MKKMTTNTLEQVTEELIDKIGLPSRNLFEFVFQRAPAGKTWKLQIDQNLVKNLSRHV